MRYWERFWILLKVSRPMLWFPLPIVFFAGLKVSGASITTISVLQGVILTFPYNLFLYGINDIYDWESDKINWRKGKVEGEVLEPDKHEFVREAALVAGLTVLLSSVATLDFSNVLAALMLLFFSHQYSSPPLRLKEKPPLDSFSSGIIYMLAPALMGFSYGSSVLQLPTEALWLTLTSMSAHSFSTIADYTADKRAGQTTFAVKFGKRAAAAFPVAVLILAFFFSGFENTIAKSYIAFSAAMFSTGLMYPNERMMHKVAGAVAVAGVVAVISVVFGIPIQL